MSAQNESTSPKRRPDREAPSSGGFRRADVVARDTYLVLDKMPAPPGNAGSGNAVR